MANLYKLIIAVFMVTFLASSCKGPDKYSGKEIQVIKKDNSNESGNQGPWITGITFKVLDSAKVIIVIYKSDSTLVDTIVNAYMGGGSYEAELVNQGWEHGLYFYKLTEISIPSGDTTVSTKKFVLLK